MTEGSNRPLITGGSGQLGSALGAVLSASFPATVCSTRLEIDVTDYDRVVTELDRLEPTVVVNCAGCTDVDGCESDPPTAFQVNRDGAANLARATRLVGARLIHISTDFVFDGRQTRAYREGDPPAPLSVYGRSKREGEKAVQDAYPDALVVRSSWVFGGLSGGFVNAILARARRGETLRVVDDQIGGPTGRFDLARAIERLLQIPATGILHFANAGRCSRHAFARAIVDAAGLHGIEVQAMPTEPQPGRAVRPACAVLDTGRYQALTGASIRDWREPLAEYLRGEDGACGS